MFNRENIVWLYLVGIVVLMVVVFFVGKDYFLPVISGERSADIETGFVFEDPPSFTLDLTQDYRARLNTSYGAMTIDLFEQSAPENVNNFVFLARRGYYDGTYFHRLVPGFFVQGGDRNTLNDDPTDDGYGSPGYIVPDEVNWDSLNLTADQREELAASGYESREGLQSQPLKRYAVAMANAGSDTNAAQFFIILAADNDIRLDQMQGRYTVVGEVIFGRDVLLELGASEIDAQNPLVPRPVRRLNVNSIEILTI